MVADHAAAKDTLMSAMVPVRGSQQPALQAALQAALHGAAAAERDAAEHVVAAFCRGNPDGQQMLASTMMPVGGPEDPGACSGFRAQGLGGPGDPGACGAQGFGLRVGARALCSGA
jgi:hypothetical protein